MIVFNYSDKGTQKVRTVTINEIYDLIRSQHYAKSVMNLRGLIGICTDQQQARLDAAQQLPTVQFSLDENGLYSGYILLSFTPRNGTQEGLKNMKSAADILPQTVMSFVGSSGKSLKIVVAATLPDGSLPKDERHARFFLEHAFVKVNSYYEAELGCRSDRHTPRLERGCRISIDEDVSLNDNVLAMTLEQPEEGISKKVRNALIRSDRKQLLTPYAGEDIPDFKDFRMQSMKWIYCYRTILDEQHEEIDIFASRLAELCMKNGLDEDFCLKRLKFMSAYESVMHVISATFDNIYHAGKYGNDNCIPKATLDCYKLIDFLKSRYYFRRNIMTGATDFKEKGNYLFEWVPVTKAVLNTITLSAITAGIEAWDKDVKRYIESDHIEEYNPVSLYLDSLPKWDKHDHVRDFALRVQTRNKDWVDDFHLWMLAMVSQWMGRNQLHANTMAPMLIGAQGDGKSTFCKLIIPPDLQPYYIDRIDFSNTNDALRAQANNLLINMDECDQLTSRQKTTLKFLQQEQNIAVRKRYSDITDHQQRFASFIATTNDPTPLTDPSGSRRYMCVDVDGKIDTTTPVNYGQMYAQLLREIKDGRRTYFSSADERRIQANNAEFQLFDVLEESFLHHYRRPKDDEEGEWLSPTQLVTELHVENVLVKNNKRTVQRIGKLLKNRGFCRKRSNSFSQYNVVRC